MVLTGNASTKEGHAIIRMHLLVAQAEPQLIRKYSRSTGILEGAAGVNTLQDASCKPREYFVIQSIRGLFT